MNRYTSPNWEGKSENIGEETSSSVGSGMTIIAIKSEPFTLKSRNFL
jgi:hypothetical protein